MRFSCDGGAQENLGCWGVTFVAILGFAFVGMVLFLLARNARATGYEEK